MLSWITEREGCGVPGENGREERVAVRAAVGGTQGGLGRRVEPQPTRVLRRSGRVPVAARVLDRGSSQAERVADARRELGGLEARGAAGFVVPAPVLGASQREQKVRASAGVRVGHEIERLNRHAVAAHRLLVCGLAHCPVAGATREVDCFLDVSPRRRL
ncbi:MAG TPA: hypothetical protein VIK03_02045, partial [Thermoleophilia bacterium]